MSRTGVTCLVIASCAGVFSGCNAIQDVLPTQPTPTPSPKTTPAPTVAPAPIPSPTATPAPPSSSSCSLPASNPSALSCAKTSPQLLNKLEKAITAATQARPGYFDLNDKKCDNCYRVLNESGYFAEVQRQLAALGVCSSAEADEIDIKASNSLSEQYDILLSSGYIRRGEGAYLYGCNPADF
jgi:hypothetical protein